MVRNRFPSGLCRIAAVLLTLLVLCLVLPGCAGVTEAEESVEATLDASYERIECTHRETAAPTTEKATEKPTEPTTEKPTEPTTEKPTEPTTEKPTEPATEKPTEPATEKPTEPTTEKPTEPTTEKPTEKPTESATEKPVERTAESTTEAEKEYVLNTNTMRFHHPRCRHVGDIKEKNRRDITATRSEIISWGYVPCKVCNP